uniref:Aminotransferase-like plant mobile domain-containing protein n=1 Tax=Vitis vinifera TaxID=29760 RepID=A5AX32_VITVI|nr:hypothetical protein VITISV_037778 [Vitis vinifera]
MTFFKCFKEKTITILEDDSEDFEEGTTLLVHKSLIDLQSLSVPVTKDPLHISSWSQVASCKLTNISNSKLNKVKPVFDVLLLNSSHPTTIEVHDEFGLLGSRVHDGEAKWGSSFKVLGESFFTEGYWEWVEEVLGRHEPFLKGWPFANVGVLPLTPCILPLERFPSPFRTCIILLDYPSLDLFKMRWYQARKSYLMMQQSPHSHQVVEIYSLHIIEFCCETKGKSLVKLASWVSFWYKGSMKYAKPPKKSTKNKAHRPKDTHNPSKEIDHVKSCTQSEMKFFDNLGIAEADVKETYLAAFLSMLVMQVRSSLGRWLGEYFDTHFISPSWNHSPQMTYYSDEFFAKCFDDLQAQTLIMFCKGVKLDHLALTHKERNLGILKTFWGVFQRFFALEETVYQHWESCIRLGTYSKVTISDYHSLKEFSVTKAYADWRIRVVGDNQFVDERDESSPKDRFKNVVPTRESMPFTSTMQQDNHFIIPLPLSCSHLDDESITNILSDVLIESQGQKTTIGDTTYDELTLLAVAGKIDELFNAITKTGVDPSPFYEDISRSTKPTFSYCYVSNCGYSKL